MTNFRLLQKVWQLSGSFIILTAILTLLSSFPAEAQYRTTTMERSRKLNNFPVYMGTDTERGLAYGNNSIYLASRKLGNFIYKIDPATGDSTGVLDMTGISGGTFPINDVAASADGSVWACNLTTTANTSAFKIYRWATEASAPANVISYNLTAVRLGDKFTVVGSATDNSLTIYAATSTTNKVYRWTTTDNGNTFALDSITLTGVSTTSPGSIPSVFPLTTGASEFVWKSNGGQGRRFNADGSVIDSLNANAVGNTGSNAVRYFTINGRKYVAVFLYTGTPQHGMRLIDVTNQYSPNHLVLDYTPSLGTTTNTNGAGDLDWKVNGDGTIDFYVLGTNNGIAAYKYDFNGLPSGNEITSFPYTTGLEDGKITSAGWSGMFIDRGTESKTGTYAARFLYNYIPAAQSGLTYGYLVSPKIQLPAAHRVKFWWKDDDITAIVGQDTTYFEVSTDNGSTWTTLGFMSRASSMSAYEEAIFDLSAYASNNFRMRWRDRTNGSFSAYGFGLDDITIEAIPQVPVIGLNPASTNFGTAYVGGSSTKTVVVNNTGGAALNVTLTLTTGITANSSSFSVPAGQAYNLNLTWTPASATTLDDSILISSDDQTNPAIYYKLSGTSVTPFVLNELVQDFDTATGTIPANWSGNFTINTIGGVNNSKRLTRNLYGTSANLTGSFTTPFVNVTATTKLRFKYRVVDFTGYPATATPDSNFKVWISLSTNYGGTFTIADSIGKGRHTVTTNYVEKEWDLGALAGQVVQVKIDGLKINGDFYVDFDDWFIGTPPVVAIDWGNLQWPGTATITAGDSVTVYGQAYKAGVTDSTGQAFGLNAWVGISTVNNNPANWTNWTPAVFNTQVGNNDEFMASIGKTLAPGTYYYAYRYQYLGGPYRYGGYATSSAGFWDSTTSVSGVLTVNAYSVTSLPYTQSFDDAAFPPTGWSVENKNSGPTWTRSTAAPRTGAGHARYSYSGTIPGNDWMITPGIALQAGETYSLSYWYKAASNAFPEKMKVLVGNAQLSDSLTNVLFDHTQIANTAYQNNVVFFTAPETRNYFFGFQAYSDADMWNLDVDDITIAQLPAVDYAATGLNQYYNAPAENIKSFNMSKEKETLQINELTGGVNASNVNNSTVFQGSAQGNLTEGLLPVYLRALIKRQGATGPAYILQNSFDGVAGNDVNRPGIATIGGVDTVALMFTPTARGTFSATIKAVATGDADTTNNSLVNDKVLVYPDSAFVVKNDDAENSSLTSIGFGTNNLPLTAGVRFTAPQSMRVANIDALYRNENAPDSIEVTIRAAGTDTTAPGAVLYSKKFAGINYINAGSATQYVTLPMGDDAPTFAAGSDFWVSLTFVSAIQFPMGAHSGAIPVPGRSFLSSDGGNTWFPLTISSTPYAWVMRTVGVSYTPPPPPAFTTLWERSQGAATLPSWFSATGSTERGFAYGRVDAGTPGREMVERVFVVSRNAGTFVKMVNAADGTDAGELNTTGITGGTFALNDIEVTDDGKILAANLITSGTAVFKVYKWDNLGSAPVSVLEYTPTSPTNARLGDKIRVTGSMADNTAVIWAVDSNNPRVLKFTMTGGAFNTTPDVVALSNGAIGGTGSAGPLPNGDFYYNSNGKNPMKFTATGTIVDTIPGTVIATGSNSIMYLGSIDRSATEYVVTFAYGAGNENAFVAAVPNGDPNVATLYGKTTSLGTNSNGNGTGDVDIKINDDNTRTIFVLSTNNGFGAYKTTTVVPVEFASFAAAAEGRNAVLNWSTATETNAKEFVIERKSGSEEWSSAGVVRAAGTTTTTQNYTFTDKNLNSGKYQYRLRQIDFDGTFAFSNTVEVEIGTPVTFELSQNYPNPFNPSTRINFSIPVAARVTLELFDISGQRVAVLMDADLNMGYHTVDVDAVKYGMSSGVYIYRINAVDVNGKNFSSTRKMALLK
ncbi:MAG: DUF4623 domain-containing protein [Ignavibacteriaceae bacterium]|nr:DUF4623 domain-containing protein [Ignavibacteriaceae bacterium]